MGFAHELGEQIPPFGRDALVDFIGKGCGYHAIESLCNTACNACQGVGIAAQGHCLADSVLKAF